MDKKPAFRTQLSRREVLAGSALLLVSASASRAEINTGHLPWAPNAGNPPVPATAGPWLFFTSAEARTVEALADRIIPPDPETPGGKDSGCAVFLDRQLAGPYGRQEGLYLRPPFESGATNQGSQSPAGPAQHYRDGRCHTIPGSGQPFAGGRAIETPFGNILAPNITPDRETGIGAWSDDEFDAAVRKGIRPNGTKLYPAMPYNAFTKMSRNDVLAIRAYLNTVRAVRNAVVADTLPFPFSVRAVMGVWDSLYFTEGEYKPDPKKSAEWNRGAYLVTGPGHCPACHTPKTLLGGDKTSQYLKGSDLQGWFAPNITDAAG
jgi:hypothetical protein